MTESPREDERTERPATATPAARLAALRTLQPLDVGLVNAIGLVCDIDDPDCVLPVALPAGFPIPRSGDQAGA